jgi:type I restriction enzyme S subunit
MSSKGKGKQARGKAADAAETSMKEEGKAMLVPKLRFPEFAGKPIRKVQLGDVTEECTTRQGKKSIPLPIKGVSKTDGIVPMEERLIGKDLARYKLVSQDWFAYNPMRINIGSIARWTGAGEVLVSPDYIVFRCVNDSESGISADYLDQFRTSLQWEKFVAGSGDGGVRIRIYYKDLALFPLNLPRIAEQQKIAGCLSSLDELIAAQARKVDELKTHKKGLMQQLFPREGETQPRLRFPEFENEGEWDEDSVEELIATVTPPKKLPTSEYRTEGEFPIIDQSQDYICGWTNDQGAVIDQGLPAIVFGDHTCALKFVDRPFAQGADGIKIIKPQRGIDVRFLFCALEANPVVQESYKRHFSMLKERKIMFPDPKSDEQHRIASCLSSLDALIAAETPKLDALKLHKKGLMQQLFPSPEEGGA